MAFSCFPPTRPHPLGLHSDPPYPPSSRAEAMSTEAQPPSTDDITTFTARLDALRADQDPDDLSNALHTAFKDRALYDEYASSLVVDTGRAQVLLEVFDKVRSVTCALP